MIAETLFVVRKPLTTRPLHYIGIQPITWSLSHTCSTERNIPLGKKLLLLPVYDSGLTAEIFRLLFQSTHRLGQTVTYERVWVGLPFTSKSNKGHFKISNLTCVMSFSWLLWKIAPSLGELWLLSPASNGHFLHYHMHDCSILGILLIYEVYSSNHFSLPE